MKTTGAKTIAGILAVAMITGTIQICILFEKPTARSIVLEITGAESQQVTVRLEADGEPRRTTHTIPARVQIDAHRLSWEVAAINGPAVGKFRVDVHVGDQESAGGIAESDRLVAGGLVGASGLRRQRAWHGRFHE